MKFYSDKYPIPENYQTNEFIFRPLRASDVELDFDAVISSSALLREWSQSDWPRDGFTLKENLSDLQWHELEHLEKEAFTYTIMNPEENFCLGCIYMNPLRQEMVDSSVCKFQEKDEEGFAARIVYWVRQSHATGDFNARVLESIIRWLDSEWYFDCVVFPVAPGDSMQAELFTKKGLVFVGKLYYESWKSHWDIYRK